MRTTTITIPAELGIATPADMPLIELFRRLHAAGHRLINDGKYNLIAVPIKPRARQSEVIDYMPAVHEDLFRPPLADDVPCQDCNLKSMHCKCRTSGYPYPF